MFTPLQSGSNRGITSQVVSIAIHGIVFFLLLRPTPPIFVRPSGLAAGGHGHATELINLPQQGAEGAFTLPLTTREQPVAAKPRVVTRRRNPDAPASVPQLQASDSTLPSAIAGSAYGSEAYGLTSGHEVRPALPVVFPDPVVSRSEIPAGVAGDVIVEVTIDAQGNVIETKLLKPFGYGFEEKVLAVLRNWRFRPATMDGVPIPSQQDVYFHFPS